MYYKGEGGAIDKRKALECWQKAAAIGYAPAQYKVGLAYMNGNGVEYNQQEGMRWIKKAADQGHKRAQLY